MSKRSALTWDPLFRPRVKDLEEYIKRFTKGEVVISNKIIFMLALAVGYSNNKTRERPPRRSDAVILSYLNDQDIALMTSIALSHSKDHNILLDQDKIFDIVEEYAAGGLEILVTQMDASPDFNNYLTKTFYTSINQYTNL